MIDIPVPNFDPEELTIAIEESDGSTIERQDLRPYYGEVVVNARSTRDEATRRACKSYAEWWLNSRIESSDMSNLRHFNASNCYLITAKLKEGESYSTRRSHNQENGYRNIRLYPDIYTYGAEYQGGLGYPITHVTDRGKNQRLIKDQEEEPRNEVINTVKREAEHKGGSGIGDPFEGEKFRIKNATTYIGHIGTLPTYNMKK